MTGNEPKRKSVQMRKKTNLIKENKYTGMSWRLKLLRVSKYTSNMYKLPKYMFVTVNIRPSKEKVLDNETC